MHLHQVFKHSNSSSSNMSTMLTISPIRSASIFSRLIKHHPTRASICTLALLQISPTTPWHSSENTLWKNIHDHLVQSIQSLARGLFSSLTNSPQTTLVDPYSFFGLGGLLKAVPKKKVSHSRKSMRSAHKGLKPNLSLGVCPACGEPKRQHFLCLHCYADKFIETRGKTSRTPWEKGITP